MAQETGTQRPGIELKQSHSQPTRRVEWRPPGLPAAAQLRSASLGEFPDPVGDPRNVQASSRSSAPRRAPARTRNRTNERPREDPGRLPARGPERSPACLLAEMPGNPGLAPGCPLPPPGARPYRKAATMGRGAQGISGDSNGNEKAPEFRGFEVGIREFLGLSGPGKWLPGPLHGNSGRGSIVGSVPRPVIKNPLFSRVLDPLFGSRAGLEPATWWLTATRSTN